MRACLLGHRAVAFQRGSLAPGCGGSGAQRRRRAVPVAARLPPPAGRCHGYPAQRAHTAGVATGAVGSRWRVAAEAPIGPGEVVVGTPLSG